MLHQPFDSPHHKFTLTSFQNYNVKEKLGNGSFGQVYKATDIASNIYVALKVRL